MAGVAVSDIRDGREPAGERLANRVLAHEPLPPLLRATRRLEYRIVGEMREDRFEVVAVERRRDRLEHRESIRIRTSAARHPTPPPAPTGVRACPSVRS